MFCLILPNHCLSWGLSKPSGPSCNRVRILRLETWWLSSNTFTLSRVPWTWTQTELTTLCVQICGVWVFRSCAAMCLYSELCPYWPQFPHKGNISGDHHRKLTTEPLLYLTGALWQGQEFQARVVFSYRLTHAHFSRFLAGLLSSGLAPHEDEHVLSPLGVVVSLLKLQYKNGWCFAPVYAIGTWPTHLTHKMPWFFLEFSF